MIELANIVWSISIVNPAVGYSLYAGAVHLAAGLSCGLTGLAAGYAIGIVGDSVRTLHCGTADPANTFCLGSAYEHTYMKRSSLSPWF